jgi:hypothetical protein
MQLGYCLIHPVAKNTTLKMKFKMYYKYKHMQI